MLTFFIPVYNEEELLEQSARRVHAYASERGIEHEIIIGSNGSDDRTVEIGERLAGAEPWCRFFHLSQRGAGRAFCRAVTEARGESIITLDADLSSDLVFVDYAVHLLRYCDMVLGSKTMGSQRRGPVRVIGSQLYIVCTQLLFDLTLSDYSIGCKAFKRDAVLPLLGTLDPWTGYMLEICLRLKQAGKRIVQVGVDCDDRRESRFNLLHEGVYRYRHLFQLWRRG